MQTQATILTNQQKLNLTLRAVLEFGIVLAFGFWGYNLGNNEGSKLFLLLLFPIVGFGIWGAIDFHQLEKNAELYRLIEELLISFIASYGLYTIGQTVLAVSLAVLTIIYHILVYSFGERLLQNI